MLPSGAIILNMKATEYGNLNMYSHRLMPKINQSVVPNVNDRMLCENHLKTFNKEVNKNKPVLAHVE